ncbi:hypothetical protein [Vibrio ouci]|uniref:Uncharacterized protein n=1 Tax=Vibrio ouci TaxID=2499078 RepID=A0A4Y8WKZ4_9VIBR|nr:hypothetical protein [Vibrio ouci]TFH93524.1 hypothetical protein ELS82_00780 [Vibrio ouci]
MGFTIPAMFSAGFITALFYFLLVGFNFTTISAYQKSTQSLASVLLPKVRQQAETSCDFSHQAINELSTKVQSMRTLSSRIKQIDDAPSDEVKQYREQMEQVYKEVLVLLQFGDRLHQQQSGIVEGVQIIEAAIERLDSCGWDEDEIREALDVIEQKTRVESNKSPHDEGSVTFF